MINGTTDISNPLAYTEVTGDSGAVDTTLCWGAGSVSGYDPAPTPSPGSDVTHSPVSCRRAVAPRRASLAHETRHALCVAGVASHCGMMHFWWC